MATHITSSTSAPYGMSIDGMRQVTGSDEPARKAKPSARAVSTISRAHSHFHERCLSLKTGAVRPSFLKTSVTSLKNW